MSDKNQNLIVIRRGKHYNSTFASVAYDENGTPQDVNIYACDSWQDGFEYAHNNQYQQVLFLDSGTVILDCEKFHQQIIQYPSQGFIAHIKYGPQDIVPELIPQAFWIDLNYFPMSVVNYECDHVVKIVSSDKNIHHDYTPLWIKPTDQTVKATAIDFLQKLMFYQLNENKKTIVNWHQKLRDNKIYLYNIDQHYYHSLWQNYCEQYTNVAEFQLWIFNNESLPKKIPMGKILTPGSGIFWMMCAIDQNCKELTICDISKSQVNFCQQLWQNWNGENYGQFVFDFMKQHKIKHFQLDDPIMSREQRIRMLNKNYLIEYINEKFDSLLQTYNIVNFASKWNNAKSKSTNFINGSILDENLDNYDAVWTSNILNYKWTFLNHNKEAFEHFEQNLKNKRIQYGS